MRYQYPNSYLEWFFYGTDGTGISEYMKDKHFDLMEEEQAYWDKITNRDEYEFEQLGEFFAHHHETGESVPAHMEAVNHIIHLLEQAA